MYKITCPYCHAGLISIVKPEDKQINNFKNWHFKKKCKEWWPKK